MRKNILVVVPDLNRLGGVSNHYLGLANHWTHNIKYEYYGKRKWLPAILWFPVDLLKFTCKLLFNKTDVVIVNPSLRNFQLIRDGIYLLLARVFYKDVITFIHGWDDKLAQDLIGSPGRFKRVYNKSSFIYVLYSHFKTQLLQTGITCPVLLTTTKVDNMLLDDFDINSREGAIKQILFLARIEKVKGIFIALQAFKLLQNEFPDIRMSVCGDGSAMQEAKKIVNDNNIRNVNFAGHVQGKELISQFKTSDLYILPTYHGEGMATSVLEAMAFGLPVITRPVGGINDFFENGKMGYLIESLDPTEYVKHIKFMLLNPELSKKMSRLNHDYANSHFLASTVAKKFEQDIKDVIG